MIILERRREPYQLTRTKAAKFGKNLKDNNNSNKLNARTSKSKRNKGNMQKSPNQQRPMDCDSHESPVKNDEDGHLVFKLGDVLINRFKIIDILGKGTFAQVVHIKHEKTDRSMALKITRNVLRHREAAKLEISTLQELNKIDPTSVHLCAKMLGCFNYHGHVCIMFEKFGLSVYEFLRNNDFYPYSIDEIRHVAYQLCYSVKFLHDNKLTHTDLKPENIIFVNSDYNLIYDGEKENYFRQLKRTDIRLIDFGNAVFDDEDHPEIISTSNFRAPEVILQLGWAQPSDVWSIACILFEMHLGYVLFAIRDSTEHLAMMERIVGEIPPTMVQATTTTYFHNGKIDLSVLEDSGRHVNRYSAPLMTYKRQDDDDHDDLFDLMQRMLEYDPSRRITLKEAMSHKFFSKIPPHQQLKN